VLAFGIDPGSHRTGWGAVLVEGSSLRFVDAGVVHAEEGQPLSRRLETIFRELSTELERIGPDHIYLEEVFHHRSAQSALVLGHARGVALLAAELRGRPIGEISPAEVKKAVTGRGRAEKEQVQEMVRRLLGLDTRAPQDASDALAIAIAGATRSRFQAALEREIQRRGIDVPPTIRRKLGR
jgi:crossover junction endodeoxyribonuclease RuvC